MSVTLVRPPPRSIVPVKEKSRKWYTLHSGSNSVFAWTFEKSNLKTSTVAFARVHDARLMASMIESYISREKEWPNVSVADRTFTLFGAGHVSQEEEQNFIEIKSWEYDDLRVFCAKSYLDMITLKKITRKSNDTFLLNGEFVTFDVPPEYYAQRLDYLFGM